MSRTTRAAHLEARALQSPRVVSNPRIRSFARALAAFAIVGCTSAAEDPKPTEPAATDTKLADRGVAHVRVDRHDVRGVVKTGGGVVFTGIAGYVSPEHTRLDLLGLPNTLNRVHFAGEVPEPDSFALDDTYDAHWPEPTPGKWDFKWMLAAIEPARQLRDRYGDDFILVLHNAPIWMASKDKGSAPVSIADYAAYCANIVRYFNKGGFRDGTTDVVPPPNVPHVNYWEIWSEPDINDYGGTDVSSFSPESYVEMYRQVTAAMRAVDPTIKIGGPNTVGDFFGPDDTRYIDALMASGEKVDFLTYHQYQANSTMNDALAFYMNDELVNYPKVKGPPIVVSEGNIDSSDKLHRAAGPFESAAMSLVYKRHVEAGTWHFIRWQSYGAGYNVIDALTGQPTLTYWSYAQFWKAMQVGATLVSCTSDTPDVDCIAALVAGKLRVVVVNRGVDHPDTDVGAQGVRLEIAVSSTTAGETIEGEAFVVDRNTDATNGPRGARFRQGPDGPNVLLDGYGMAGLWER